MKYRDFFIFEAAQIINGFCIGMLSMLLSWIMIHDYNLESQLGWFMTSRMFFMMLGMAVVGLFGSYMAPKATLVTMGLMRVILVTSLVIFFGAQPYAIGITIIGLSLFGAIGGAFYPTISAGLYDKENFHNALRINNFISSTIGIFAGAVTGFLISQFSYNNLLWASAIGVCISFIAFIIIKPKISEQKTVKPHYSVGFRAVMNNRFELWFALFAAMSNFVLSPTLMYIVPILIIKVYSYNSVAVGAVEGVFAVSSLIASGFLNKYLNRLLGVYLASIAGLIFVGFGFLLVVFGNNIVYLFVAILIIGVGLTTSMINISNIHIIATPDDVRPSAGAVNSMLSMWLIPFGILFITKMNELGYLHTVLIIFVVIYLVMALSLLLLKDFKLLASYDNKDLENKYVDMYPKAYKNYG